MKSIQQRLNNIAGQIEGIKKMVDRNQDCLKILIQLKATKAAIGSVMETVVEEQFESCLKSVKNEDKKLLIKIKKYVSPINVSGQENFASEVIKSELPVLVDFWAPWCGPCQMMAPILTELATKFEGKLKVVKVDTDLPENQQLAMDYQIQSIPNMKLFIKGELVKDFIGYRDESTFSEELKPFIGG